jgi:hypothetical protein
MTIESTDKINDRRERQDLETGCRRDAESTDENWDEMIARLRDRFIICN